MSKLMHINFFMFKRRQSEVIEGIISHHQAGAPGIG